MPSSDQVAEVAGRRWPGGAGDPVPLVAPVGAAELRGDVRREAEGLDARRRSSATTDLQRAAVGVLGVLGDLHRGLEAALGHHQLGHLGGQVDRRARGRSRRRRPAGCPGRGRAGPRGRSSAMPGDLDAAAGREPARSASAPGRRSRSVRVTVLTLAMLLASASSQVWCMPREEPAMRSRSKAPITEPAATVRTRSKRSLGRAGDDLVLELRLDRGQRLLAEVDVVAVGTDRGVGRRTDRGRPRRGSPPAIAARRLDSKSTLRGAVARGVDVRDVVGDDLLARSTMPSSAESEHRADRDRRWRRTRRPPWRTRTVPIHRRGGERSLLEGSFGAPVADLRGSRHPSVDVADRTSRVVRSGHAARSVRRRRRGRPAARRPATGRSPGPRGRRRRARGGCVPSRGGERRLQALLPARAAPRPGRQVGRDRAVEVRLVPVVDPGSRGCGSRRGAASLLRQHQVELEPVERGLPVEVQVAARPGQHRHARHRDERAGGLRARCRAGRRPGRGSTRRSRGPCRRWPRPAGGSR